MKTIGTFLTSLFISLPGFAQTPQLVKDLNTNVGQNQPDDFGSYQTLNTTTKLFWADDKIHGTELWKTDGTEAGTQTPDLYELNNSSLPRSFIVSSDVLFLTAETIKGRELWKVTTPCTQMISVKTGSWNDPALWSCNRIPLVSDNVTIETGPIVTIPTGQFPVKKVTTRGKLTFVAGSVLLFAGY